MAWIVGAETVCFIQTCGKVPAWRKFRDYTNEHKCINQEMKDIYDACQEYSRSRFDATRTEFMRRMSECSHTKYGVPSFDGLTKGCTNAVNYRKMEDCRATVTAAMMAEREPAP